MEVGVYAIDVSTNFAGNFIKSPEWIVFLPAPSTFQSKWMASFDDPLSSCFNLSWSTPSTPYKDFKYEMTIESSNQEVLYTAYSENSTLEKSISFFKELSQIDFKQSKQQ